MQSSGEQIVFIGQISLLGVPCPLKITSFLQVTVTENHHRASFSHNHTPPEQTGVALQTLLRLFPNPIGTRPPAWSLHHSPRRGRVPERGLRWLPVLICQPVLPPLCRTRDLGGGEMVQRKRQFYPFVLPSN